MEMDLKTIIEKIKTEGVSEAEKQAGEMIGTAKKKAEEILAQAVAISEEKRRQTEKETERFRKSAEEAVRQAARDTLLGLKEDIVRLFDRITKKETSGALSSAAVNDAVVALISNFRKDSGADIEVLTSQAQRDSLEKGLIKALKDEIAKGVVIKASPNIENGFRVGIKGENYYYDFADDAVAEAFKNYLNPRLSGILEGSGTDGK
ncbi:MAG: hypothetical protein PHT95_01350 [Candidatus Omnitrophica bacterium]|nr:hypothetical protein [Candidatus Omnitrophota bacterium]MDD4013424.1 hypothetical protein [Candidatus Omnitrophota bacterium]